MATNRTIKEDARPRQSFAKNYPRFPPEIRTAPAGDRHDVAEYEDQDGGQKPWKIENGWEIRLSTANIQAANRRAPMIDQPAPTAAVVAMPHFS
jgi:hypothetical protein